MQPIDTVFPRTRSRRLRQNRQIRDLVAENSLSISDLIWPLFVCEGKNIKEKILTKDHKFTFLRKDNNEEVFNLVLVRPKVAHF